MSTLISQRELRNDNAVIMRRVERGESFTVTRNGTPVADLVPHRDAEAVPPRFMTVAAIASGFAALPDWGATSFAGEIAAADRALDDTDVDRWSQG